MVRYFIPALLLAGAAYIWHYNEAHVGRSALLLPLLNRIPALSGDIQAQAEWTWMISAAIGGAALLVIFFGHLRELSAARNDREE